MFTIAAHYSNQGNFVRVRIKHVLSQIVCIFESTLKIAKPKTVHASFDTVVSKCKSKSFMLLDAD